MANLIITIISIALVAITVAMGVYFLGDVFSQNTAKINANNIINESQQIAAAAKIYMAERGVNSYDPIHADITALTVNKYLSAFPSVMGKPATIQSTTSEKTACLKSDNSNYYTLTRSLCVFNGKNSIIYDARYFSDNACTSQLGGQAGNDNFYQACLYYNQNLRGNSTAPINGGYNLPITYVNICGNVNPGTPNDSVNNICITDGNDHYIIFNN